MILCWVGSLPEDVWFPPLACPLVVLVRFLPLLMNSIPTLLGLFTLSVSSFTLGVGFPTGIPLQDSSLQLVVLQGIRCLLIDGILPEEPLPFAVH